MKQQYDPDKHHRRSIRLKDYDYTQSGAYFITVCAYNRECIFGEIIDGEMRLNDFGELVKMEWLRTEEVRPNVTLDTFVVMPNHFHMIIVICNNGDSVGATRRVARPQSKRSSGPAPGSIGAIVGQFKSVVTKRINEIRKMPGVSVWQRNYYEHIIRDDDDLNRIREYIVSNPARWELDYLHPTREL